MKTMTPDKFVEIVDKHNDGKDYGLCPQPYPANKCMDILIEHLLGKDWYTTMPMGPEQVNTEATYEIIRRYNKMGSMRCRLTDGVADTCRSLIKLCARSKRS